MKLKRHEAIKRALDANPALTQAALAAELGISRQAVSAAMRYAPRFGRRGPPRKFPPCEHCGGSGNQKQKDGAT